MNYDGLAGGRAAGGEDVGGIKLHHRPNWQQYLPTQFTLMVWKELNPFLDSNKLSK